MTPSVLSRHLPVITNACLSFRLLTFDQLTVCAGDGIENALYSYMFTISASFTHFAPFTRGRFLLVLQSILTLGMSSPLRVVVLFGLPLGLIAFVGPPAGYTRTPDSVVQKNEADVHSLLSNPMRENYVDLSPLFDRLGLKSLHRKCRYVSLVNVWQSPGNVTSQPVGSV